MLDLQSDLLLRDWSADRHICHFIGTGPAILAGAGISGASSLAGGKKGSNASITAASIQAQTAQKALDLQKSIYEQNMANIEPYMGMGTAGMSGFTNFLNGPFQQNVQAYPSAPFSFPAFTGQPPAPFVFNPTQQQLQNVPGYTFESTAAGDAALGQLISQGRGPGSGTAMTAARIGADYSSQDVLNYFNMQQQQYQAALQNFQAGITGYNTNFNTATSQYTTNENALLAGGALSLQNLQQKLAGLEAPINIGLTGTDALAGVGSQYAGLASNTLQGQGAALASGVVGSANALTGSLSGLANATQTGIGQYVNQQNFAQLLNQTGGGNPNYNVPVGSDPAPIPNAQGTANV